MTAMGEERAGLADWGLRLFFLGLAVVLIGFALVVLGMLLQPSTPFSDSFGGVVLIGPIPILFGAGPEASTLIVIGLVIAVVLMIVSLLTARRR